MKLCILLRFALVLLLSGAGCKSNWKEAEGADLVIYFENISDDEKRQIEAIASRHSQERDKYRISESMVSNKLTIRIWLTNAEEYQKSKKPDLMKKTMDKVMVPDLFEFSK